MLAKTHIQFKERQLLLAVCGFMTDLLFQQSFVAKRAVPILLRFQLRCSSFRRDTVIAYLSTALALKVPGAMPGSFKPIHFYERIFYPPFPCPHEYCLHLRQKKIEVNIPYSRHVLTGVNAYAYVCLPLIFVSGLFILPSPCGNVLTQPISDVVPLRGVRRT